MQSLQSDAHSRLLDVVAFSGALPAVVAAALAAATGTVLVPDSQSGALATVAGLAAAGTLVIYSVDRLRDLERDRETAPGRTHFVQTHRRYVLAATVAGAAACVPLALRMPPGVWALCAGVLTLGLWHRRLKGRAPWKVLYVAAAWLGVVVGLPVVAGGGAALRPLAAVLAALGVTIAANLLASDLREHSLTRARQRDLAIARALAIAGTLFCLLDRRTWALIPIPLFEALSLLGFRTSERYGLVVVDGALLVGAGLSLGVALGGR
ncbi:MAG: hypothetical protein JRG92_18530 [Deltaproteobacteria bacterium]|nr:hypothetical protein [Deltaproteobacteria bacterium]MBW2695275.1 hypothetical protein [Deltaproteobacteria bacterium]